MISTESREICTDLAVEIQLWKPLPGHAKIKVGENGTRKGEIVFSNLQGFVSGSELLEDPSVFSAVTRGFRDILSGAEEERLKQALNELSDVRQVEQIRNRLVLLCEPCRRALCGNALLYLGVNLITERR